MVLALTLALCGAVSVTRADPNTLQPGGGLYPIAAGPGVSSGATLLAYTNVYFSSASLNGYLISSVYSGNTYDPYGGLTFTYQVIVNGASPDGVSAFTIASYAGFTNIDVTYDSTQGGIVPTTVSRSTTTQDNGSLLNFHYLGAPFGNGSLPPGTNSAVMDVYTGAPLFYSTFASVIDNFAVPGVPTFGPSPDIIPTPEPSSMGLMATGGLLTFGYLRRWRNRSR